MTDYLLKGYDGIQNIEISGVQYTKDQIQQSLRSQILLVAKAHPIIGQNIQMLTVQDQNEKAAEFLRGPDIIMELKRELSVARKHEGEYAIDLVSRDRAKARVDEFRLAMRDNSGFVDKPTKEQMDAATTKFEVERNKRNTQEEELLNNMGSIVGKAYENML